MSLRMILNLPYIRNVKNYVNKKLEMIDQKLVVRENFLKIKQEKFLDKFHEYYFKQSKNIRFKRRIIKMSRFFNGFFPVFICLILIQYYHFIVVQDFHRYIVDISDEMIDFDIQDRNYKDYMYELDKLKSIQKISKIDKESIPLIDILYFSHYFSEKRPNLSFILMHLAHLKNPDLIDTNSFIDYESLNKSKNFEEFLSKNISN